MPTMRFRATWDADSDGTTSVNKYATTLKVGAATPTGSVYWRAVLEFDITNLPVSADVTRVELEVTVKKAGGPGAIWTISAYNATGLTDPETATASSLNTYSYPDTGRLVTYDRLFRCTGRHRFVLGLGAGASACTLLETANAAAENRFSVALASVPGELVGTNDWSYCELEAEDCADDGPAELIITYNETTAVTTLLAALAQRIDRTRYQSSTLTTSSATVPADTSTLHRAGYWDEHWMLLGAGTYIGASRQVNTWTPSVYTLAKAFTGATGTVAYEMYPFPPDLATRAINEAISELFPAFVYLPYEYECLVANERQQYYDMPSGMGWVGEVDWRATVTTPDWYPVAFERVDDTRIRVAGRLPSEAKVLRLRGRQQLTKFDYADPLTLTEVTEVLYPETWDAPVVELLLAYAEWKLHKWVFVDWDKPPAPGTLPPATYRKIDFLEKEITRLKRAVGRRGRRMSEVRSI